MLLLAGCTQHNRHTKISDITIRYSYDNTHEFIIIPLGGGRYFLLDTGTEKSIVFRDRIKIKSTFRQFALLNRQRLISIRNAKSFQIGDLLIENFNFVYMRSRNTLWENDTTIVGIIGMDILSQIYSYFDIKNQTIIFSNERKNKAESPSLILSYKKPTRPLVSLCINGIAFEYVLFDTGFNRFLGLLKTDKEILNLQVEAMGALIQGIIGNSRPAYRKTPNYVKINNVVFDAPIIMYSRTHIPRLLGMGFIRQFSSFSIDPFERKIMFFE